MSYAILTASRFDLAEFRRRAERGEGPRHLVNQIADDLDATVIQPGDVPPSRLDLVTAKLLGTTAELVAAARKAAAGGPEQVVYCIGDDSGLAFLLASLFARKRCRPLIYVMAPQRTRVRLALVAMRLLRRFPMLIVGTEAKRHYLVDRLGWEPSRLLQAIEQCDEHFFVPDPLIGSDRAALHEPAWVASVGLEQRDYVTLAEATKDLDCSVRVCAVSPNFSARTNVTLPDPEPANFEMRHFDWPELRELYQQSAVLVVSLLDNVYSAGLTALLEGIACGTPAILTRTQGLGSSLIDHDLVIGVPPGDPDALRDAIQSVLDDPQSAVDRAKRARDYYLLNHTSEQMFGTISTAMRSLRDAPALGE